MLLLKTSRNAFLSHWKAAYALAVPKAGDRTGARPGDTDCIYRACAELCKRRGKVFHDRIITKKKAPPLAIGGLSAADAGGWGDWGRDRGTRTMRAAILGSTSIARLASSRL